MQERKELKIRAKKVLKRHYWMMVALCLIAAVTGAEFAGSANPGGVAREETSGGAGTQMSLAGTMAGEFFQTLEEVLTGDEESGKKEAMKKEAEYVSRSEAHRTAVLGRSRGVFSDIVNGIASGAYLITLAIGVQSVVGSGDVTAVILVALGLAVVFFVEVFVISLYRVIMRRMFLEGRIYAKLPVSRAWYLLRVKRWFRAGMTLFLTGLVEFLWWLTIIGGVVKHFSYYMVPYIVAENPGIGAREAMRLSAGMMRGHKWECFKLRVSFLGWWLLGGVTLGLSSIFYSNPYMTAVMGEYYTELRELAKKNRIPYAEQLNDPYLFQRADALTLLEAYYDVYEEEEQPSVWMEDPGRIRRFLAETFGIVIGHKAELDAYEKEQARLLKLSYDRDAYHGDAFPTRLSGIPEKQKRKWIENLNYLRRYSVWSLILMFFVMSVAGWIWEVSIHLITDGEFSNRGVLHGPWLPIYGAGTVLILVLLNRFRRWPVVEFVTAVILCGCVEYFTSCYLELASNGKRWWDYTGYFLNLDGRICAEGLLAFGMGGMLMVYVLAPFLDQIIRQIPFKPLAISCVLLVGVFGADQVYSSGHPNVGRGITDYQ